MKKVMAFIAVGILYICMSLSFSWADNSGAIDNLLNILGLDQNDAAVQEFSIVSGTSMDQQNMPIPPPPFPPDVESALANMPIPPPPFPPDVELAGNMPIPPPPFPPDVELAGNMPIPPPPFPPDVELAGNMPIPPPPFPPDVELAGNMPIPPPPFPPDVADKLV